MNLIDAPRLKSYSEVSSSMNSSRSFCGPYLNCAYSLLSDIKTVITTSKVGTVNFLGMVCWLLSTNIDRLQ